MLFRFRLLSRDTFLQVTGALALAVCLTCAVGPIESQAQTPTTTVKDASGNTVFQSFAEGQLLVPGPYSAGATIPATGSGTRLMWWPEKAAFRAGQVGGTQWDASNVGSYSVALNNDTKASGIYSTAMGFETISEAFASLALGANTRAEATNSVAMGQLTVATGDEAVVMGRGTKAGTDHSLTLGQCNNANTSFGGPLFVVGDGSWESATESCDIRSDALVLQQNGDLTISGTLTESSDRRLKTGIEALDDGVLGRLAEIRPVRYSFENEQTHPSGEQIGLVAQDVRKEFPELVSEGASGYLSLSYTKLTAVLVKGLQEQQAQLDAKQSQIDSLKRRVRSLGTVKKRLSALEAKVSSSAEASPSDPTLAGLAGPWGFGLLLGLTGLGAGLLWRRRA